MFDPHFLPPATPAGDLRFHPIARLTDLDVAEVLATVETRVARLLDRHGLYDPHDAAGTCDNWQEETPVLAGLAGNQGSREGNEEKQTR